jgi:hypothetical protein
MNALGSHVVLAIDGLSPHSTGPEQSKNILLANHVLNQ